MASLFHAGVLMGRVREREEKAPGGKAYILTNCESEISLWEWRSLTGRFDADFREDTNTSTTKTQITLCMSSSNSNAGISLVGICRLCSGTAVPKSTEACGSHAPIPDTPFSPFRMKNSWLIWHKQVPSFGGDSFVSNVTRWLYHSFCIFHFLQHLPCWNYDLAFLNQCKLEKRRTIRLLCRWRISLRLVLIK